MNDVPECARLEALAAALGPALKRRGWMLATAESCTGGWVATTVTAISGSSDWFERGFVTYTNDAKRELLGVPAATLETHGAVSAESAAAMAQGALHHSHAQVAVAITGVAGPTGGSALKPVGTVWFGFATVQPATVVTRLRRFAGDRHAVRARAVEFALRGLLALSGDAPVPE
jgi:nicotinamide-nucleotide amidase